MGISMPADGWSSSGTMRNAMNYRCTTEGLFLHGLDGDDGQLRPAQESNRDQGHPDSAAHVHARAVLLEPAAHIRPHAPGQPQALKPRHVHLSAMRMAGQGQVVASRARGEELRTVKKGNGKGACGRAGKRAVEVGTAE